MSDPCYKVCYNTRQDAKNDRRILKKAGRPLTSVYWCETCSAYHLTSQPKSDRKRLRKKFKNKKP